MSQVRGLIQGLHHITLVTRSQQVNHHFYTEILGLRRVKLTVNQDDVYHRHLFYADEHGTPGSAITFFEWPELQPGKIGLGAPHHLAYAVRRAEVLPRWKVWLQGHRVPVTNLHLRERQVSLYLRDPDGVLLELTAPTDTHWDPAYVAELERGLPTVTSLTPEMRLVRFHHGTPVSSDAQLTGRFLDSLLGLQAAPPKPNPDDARAQLLEVGNEPEPAFLRYLFYLDPPQGLVGAGNIHHIAVSVETEQEQLRILRRLTEGGIRTSGIVDRLWFRSLYFRDPDGNLLEVATKGPGYEADESPERLGARLALPPWLEPRRAEIEGKLAELDQANPSPWPPTFDHAPIPVERL